jgi:hypothetical protein
MAPASGTQYLLVGADVVLTVDRNAEMRPVRAELTKVTQRRARRNEEQ